MCRKAAPERTDEMRRKPSREAAKECSPRRKPWELFTKETQAPKGRKKIMPMLKRFSAWARRLILTRDAHVAYPAHSIPNVPFVVLNMMFLQKRDELLLKRMLLMMLLLPRDVFGDCPGVRFADPENAVPALPSKSW